MAIAEQRITDKYAIYLGDCMEVLPQLPEGSVHFSIYSPPFGGLYHYSSSERDLSNSRDYGEFFDHYDFVVREVARFTMPGRMTAVHCMDVPTGNTGKDATIDFPGDITELHVGCRREDCQAPRWKRKNGMCGHGLFERVARYHIWKEPLTVRNRTLAKNLAHKTIVEDSSRCSAASADYLLVFRRKGRNPVPIVHPHGLMSYAGAREVPRELLPYRGWEGKQTGNRYSHWIWRQYASAFWDDVRLDRVLPFRPARDADDEKHVHPLQLDAIERALTLWTNPGEIVVTPFMGVGSEVYVSVEMGRRGFGIELKPSYYRQSERNLGALGRGSHEQVELEWSASGAGELLWDSEVEEDEDPEEETLGGGGVDGPDDPLGWGDRP